jgi:hypothetical protein
MTVLSINMTTSDEETTWADVKPTIHPVNRLHALSASIWKLTAELDDKLDRSDIRALQDIAQELDDYSDDMHDEYENRQYAKAVMQEEGLP